MPKVSIITSLPAQSNSLDATAASVFGQSMPDWEWIIAGTSALPASCRDAAQSAHADLLFFLDSGDLLEPAALEKLWWFLETHPEYAFARGLLREPADLNRFTMFRKAAFLAGHPNRGGTIPEVLSSLSNRPPKPPAKRRLLMLAPHLEIGGADKFNLDLIACLQRDHSYEVSVITTRSSPHRWRELFEHLTPDVFTLHTFLPVEHYSQFISHFIETRKPDTVLIANSRVGYQLLPLLRTPSGPSFVDYLHMEESGDQAYPQLSLNYAAFLDSTIVSSEHLKKSLIEAGRDSSRIHVSTTSIDPQLWDSSHYDKPSIRAKYDVPEGVPVIAFVARLCKQKQPDVMATVLKTIRDRGLKFKCFVAGDGDHRPWLENFIAKNRLQEVQLLGSVPSEQVREILAISDVYFMPSENEGIALTLFEAMSMGVPPLGADVGGQRELVAPDCGILIQAGPSQALDYAGALQRLLTDRGLRSSMASKSRERILDRFTLYEMGNRMALLFECAAANRADNPNAAYKKLDAEQPASPLRGFLTTTSLVLSPKNFGLKLKNLSLLGRIIANRKKRLRLAGAFDARYYLSHNPDVQATGVAPLIHYALQGYLEERLPSPHFDAPSSDGVNPMLRRINQHD